jgi:hypothetical protein
MGRSIKGPPEVNAIANCINSMWNVENVNN